MMWCDLCNCVAGEGWCSKCAAALCEENRRAALDDYKGIKQ